MQCLYRLTKGEYQEGDDNKNEEKLKEAGKDSEKEKKAKERKEYNRKVTKGLLSHVHDDDTITKVIDLFNKYPFFYIIFY